MEKIKSFFRSFKQNLKLPAKDEIKQALNSFSKKERIIFVLLFIAVLFSTLNLLWRINSFFLVEVPASGGSLTEGIIGTPRFINPVLALSDPDKDLTALVYSGLMRKTSDGGLEPDLAESYTVSKDYLTYTFTLKKGIYFQDNTPVTADDVVFTVNEIKNPNIKSPKKINWDGVTAAKIDDQTVQFSLKQPYASFLDNLTVGILPSRLWKNISDDQFSFDELNIKPVGSGPYKVDSVKNKSGGIPDYYVLKSFGRFVLGTPFISKLTVRFYPGEDELIGALQNGSVDQINSITPEKAQYLKANGYKVETAVLPRIFGLFFNQNESPIFADTKVIGAFEDAINKDEIIQNVLYGYATAIDSPVPQNMVEYTSLSENEADKKAPTADDIASAKAAGLAAGQKALADDGWALDSNNVLAKPDPKNKKQNIELSFSISTGDAPELKAAAELIKNDLEALGVQVDVKVFDIGSLNQDVIRPRKYEALLFGEVVNNEGDLFAFWHSSQRNDPGLNITMYTNAKVDKILETALGNLSDKDRLDEYAAFQQEIAKDKPAIFLYSPEFIYVVAKNLQGNIINKITSPADRFAEVYKWYRESDQVWKVFNKEK